MRSFTTRTKEQSLQRNTESGVEVSTTTFRHTRTGKRVVFMCDTHWGVLAYWRMVQEQLDAFNGPVLREGTPGASLDQSRERWEKHRRELVESWGYDSYTLMERFCGAKYLLASSLHDPDVFIVSEPSDEEEDEAYPKDAETTGKQEEDSDSPQKDIASILLQRDDLLQSLFGFLWRNVYWIMFPESSRWVALQKEAESRGLGKHFEATGTMLFHISQETFDRYVVFRERVFWRFICEQTTHSDCLVFYGLGHYPGIAQRLWGAGYRIESRDWRSAFSCPKVSQHTFFEALENLRGALEK